MPRVPSLKVGLRRRFRKVENGVCIRPTGCSAYRGILLFFISSNSKRNPALLLPRIVEGMVMNEWELLFVCRSYSFPAFDKLLSSFFDQLQYNYPENQVVAGLQAF